MKNKIKEVFLYLFISILLVGLGYFISHFKLVSDWMLIALYFIYIPFCFFLSIQLHELGHLFFGKISGYSLLELNIAGLCWRYENGRYKFLFERTKGFSGSCKMLPPTDAVNSTKDILFYSGGIIANVLTGVIAIVGALIATSLNSYILLALWEFGFVSLLMAVINSRPVVAANNPRDGKIIKSILDKDDFFKDFTFINAALAELTAGVRPKEITFLNEPLDETEVPGELYIYKLIYHLYNAIDKRDREKLEDCLILLERNKARIPSAIEKAVCYEMAGAYCLLQEKEKASEYYTLYRSSLEEEKDLNGNRIKAYCAYIVDNDIRSALEYCQKGLQVAGKYPLKGQQIMEEELIYKLQKEIEQHG